MTLRDIITKHQGSYAIAFPKSWDAESNHVVNWGCLQTCRQLKKLEELLKYYELEGFEGVVAIPCFSEDDIRATNLPPEMCAALYRSYLGMEGGA